MKRVVIVGSGVAGIRAAYSLRALGYDVTVVEKNPYTGGVITLLDKQFPTDNCGFCRLIPQMGCDDTEEYCLKRGAGNIELIRGYEVKAIEGEFPSLRVKLLRESPYVIFERCIGCRRCEDVCKIHSTYFEFNSAIHRATKFSSLNEYTIDSTCTKCGKCLNVCPTDAIVLEGVEERVVECNAVLLAQGISELSPYENCSSYGYGRYKDVITSLELERILSLNEGKVKRLSDGVEPYSIAFVQCVGSRDEVNPYCSSACCMFTLKEIRMIKEKDPNKNITVFFMDLRAFGKEYWKYFREIDGVSFIRCRVASVDSAGDGNLIVQYETEDGKSETGQFELVVLAVGQRPSKAIAELAEKSGLFITEDGYIKRKSFDSFETTKDGVFLAGNIVEPKDISDSLTDGLAVSAEIARKLGEQSKKVASEVPDDASGTLVFLCNCDNEISKNINFDELEKGIKKLENIISVQKYERLCNPDGLKRLGENIKKFKPSSLLIGACQGYYFSSLFNKFISDALGYSPKLRIVDLKTSKVDTDCALSMLRANMRILSSLASEKVSFEPKTREVLVIGGGSSGLTAALTLAESDIPVTICESSSSLGGNCLKSNGIYNGIELAPFLAKKVDSVHKNPKITVRLGQDVESVDGRLGEYRVKFRGESEIKRFAAVIVATGAKERKPKIMNIIKENLILNTNFTQILENVRLGHKSIGFVQCVECLTDYRPYCSRFCCRKSMELALKILEIQPESRIFFFVKEVMSYGASEKLYRKLREKGVTFIRYSEKYPLYFISNGILYDINGEESFELLVSQGLGYDGKLGVVVFDSLIERYLAIEFDNVIIASGVEPLNVSFLDIKRDKAGFLSGLDTKFSPQETSLYGIVVAGSARMPMNFGEALIDGKAAAQVVLEYLKGVSYFSRGIKAYVSQRKCVKCLLCVPACPYEARYYDDSNDIVIVNEILCKGCGTCAMVCPSKATDMKGFSAKALLDAVDDLTT